MSKCKRADKIKIIKGEDRNLVLNLVDENSGENFNLTGWTAEKAVFKNEDGTNIEKIGGDVTINSPEELGKVTVNLSDTDTSAMAESEGASFELEISMGTETRIVQFVEALEIIARL